MAHAAARCGSGALYWGRALDDLATRDDLNRPHAVPEGLAEVAARSRERAMTIAEAARSGHQPDPTTVAEIRAAAEPADADFRKENAKPMMDRATESADGDTRYLHYLTRWAAKPPPASPVPPAGHRPGAPGRHRSSSGAVGRQVGRRRGSPQAGGQGACRARQDRRAGRRGGFHAALGAGSFARALWPFPPVLRSDGLLGQLRGMMAECAQRLPITAQGGCIVGSP